MSGKCKVVIVGDGAIGKVSALCDTMRPLNSSLRWQTFLLTSLLQEEGEIDWEADECEQRRMRVECGHY